MYRVDIGIPTLHGHHGNTDRAVPVADRIIYDCLFLRKSSVYLSGSSICCNSLLTNIKTIFLAKRNQHQSLIAKWSLFIINYLNNLMRHQNVRFAET